jgi:hypothetical protein
MGWISGIRQRVPAAGIRRVLYLLAAAVIFAAGYWLSWRMRPASPVPGQTPVATAGGGTVYEGPQVPAVEKAKKKGKAKPKVETRPVATVPTEDLPPEEQAKVPDVPAVVGPDGVLRKPELLGSAVVPPARGETHVRAFLMPDGYTQIDQDPQGEKFWGWSWKRLELEGRLGLAGNTQAKGTARWLPLRMGNVHAGAEGSVATETDGVVRGEGMLMIRWEPFRDQYR